MSSHLRRLPDRPLTATAVPGGWRFDGSAPWYTGWGLNDVALVGAATEDGRIVWGLVEPPEGPHLSSGPLLAVAALQAARTVALTVDGLVVADRDVVSVQPVQEWEATDRRAHAHANPAVFGVAASCVRLLAELGGRRGDPEAVAAAHRLGVRVDAVRRRADALLDAPPRQDPDDDLDRRLAVRVEAARVALDAAAALVAAGGGGSMSTASPAQRKAREALFLLVQAQTHGFRSASLRSW